ncbi:MULTISPECIES: hypothetical protein [Alloalcanivorax]|jgi:hypothetical protein|uniref:Uncharacterized protein n=3 Tax=Alloalcanivorax TaxID=3020832 RepID=K0CIZ9_ALCDB|nr:MULTISPECIES: hypothetical protein [Alloalcanivorax]ERS13288.1 hypothetical protein Q668_15515 [Alcanivorax sp. PN-3]KYZ87516.1 hypothetical protein A3Q32_12865 [Alcanivorax sp. KX64203]MBA4721140.1 hypothetical protein [Alcanivorax sp.]AFT71546.1 hypothetical protein B5T_03279 [Alloalcanivorax dieselolei B5]ARB46614.1 hypothetical protein P40_15350 [Alloalcanivorax xenomutans]|tara:strand:- start:2555 stop:2767 length:213 start_codon:yes stop_codon:yes gene_type:complete
MSQHDQDHDTLEEARELLDTIEQVEEALTVMTTVVAQLKEQVATHLEDDTEEITAEEFLERCENLAGTWH